MGARSVPQVDYSKSTMAFPMPKEPTPVFVDSDIDYSKSTGAYPMYDERNQPERVVEFYDAPVEAHFATPGPVSSGLEEHVAQQRADLGLSGDTSGDSDAGHKAQPAGQAETKVVQPEDEDPRPKTNRRASTKKQS